MKKPFSRLVSALALLSASFSIAAPTGIQSNSAQSGPEHFALIHRGNWKAAGTFNGYHSNYGSGHNAITLSSGVEYFLMDHLSVGGLFSWSDNSIDDATISIGPSATYFILEKDRIAPYVKAIALKGITDDTFSWIIKTAFGVDYFIHPSVSFGPDFFISHYTRRYGYDSSLRYGLEAGFSIFL